jgi:hypothetical protein
MVFDSTSINRVIKVKNKAIIAMRNNAEGESKVLFHFISDIHFSGSSIFERMCG